MKTGKKASHLGLYVSACCKQELLFDAGDRLTGCFNCADDTKWKLVERVISWRELEQMEETSFESLLAA